MTQLHTSGPWHFEKAQAGQFNNDDKIVGGGVAIAYMPVKANVDAIKQNEANAYLMAAAPELLAALEQVLLDCKDDNAELPDTTGHMILRAIKKSKGQM